MALSLEVAGYPPQADCDLIILVIYRLAANIPVPGINGAALKALLQGANGSGNFFAFLDLLSGGTISRFSLLAMGVYPYITAQIILHC